MLKRDDSAGKSTFYTERPVRLRETSIGAVKNEVNMLTFFAVLFVFFELLHGEFFEVIVFWHFLNQRILE